DNCGYEDEPAGIGHAEKIFKDLGTGDELCGDIEYIEQQYKGCADTQHIALVEIPQPVGKGYGFLCRIELPDLLRDHQDTGRPAKYYCEKQPPISKSPFIRPSRVAQKRCRAQIGCRK